MPKIRKKTTNRAKTNDRAKLKHKVKESRKKKVKAAKKNPQWKSKHKKDPGIPNDFPYKDQILAEVAEQRRIAAEEKQKRKEEKRLLAARAKAGLSNEEGDDAVSQEQMEVDHDDELEVTGKDRLNVGSDGIASLSAKLVNKALKPRPKPVEVEAEDEEEEEEDDVPVLINRDLPTLKSALDSADVIVQVLDARDPMSCRSLHLETLAKESGKKMLLVVNKIDACPREAVASWTAYLRSECPALLFRSATAFLPAGPEQVNVKVKGKGKAKVTVPADDAVGVDSVLECLGQWAQEKKNEKPLTVAVVGITNVGKSSFVNSLLRKRVLPVYSLSSSSRGPTTTDLPQETTLEVAGKQIRFIDTPGLSFAANDSVEEEDQAQDQNEIRGRDILLRNKGRIDRLKDPSFPVAHIVARGNAEDLMLLYSIPAFAKGDAEAFLSGVARANQLIKKKGQLDLTGAARIVLRDWSLGKLARYTTASAAAPSSDDPALDVAKLYTNDEPILASLKTRKEMRKAGGVIKFSAGAVETRKVAVDEPWVGLVGEDDEDEGEESEEDGSEIGQDSKDEDEEDEEDDEEEEMGEGEDTDDDEDDEEDTPPPPSNKQKRKRGAEPALPTPPSKRVAFAADPKTSKQARKAGSLKLKAQQQKPAPIPAKKVEEPKQPLKAVETAKSKLPVKEKKVVEKKVANVAAKKAKGSKPAKSPTTKGPEAYDFSKFF